MHVQARRVFRMSLTMALSLAIGYGLSFPLPFIAPLFALFLTLAPGPPIGLKGLFGLVLVLLVTLSSGLLLIPLLLHYPISAILIVAVGLYFGNYLTVNMQKGLVGAFVTVGFTLISAAGLLDYQVATAVVQSLVLGIVLAILCQWVVYGLFPEDAIPAAKKPPAAKPEQSNWIALRATLIVLPAYLLALTNPGAYLAIIMKSVSLGQQGSMMSARDAGWELLGSTFLAGCFAVAFWFLLKLNPNLWMYFLWTLLFGTYFAAKIYRLIPTRFPPSFWLNVGVTLLILVGPAVEDSANGKDVYEAFFVRMGLFVGVTLYAWLAIVFLEKLRAHRMRRISRTTPNTGLPQC